MPVILNQITAPSPMDREDLCKIYCDYSPATSNEEGDAAIWIEQQLTQHRSLFAGRFNGRLVGAVWGEPDHKTLRLDHLCIRDLTRRRGVARQLLNLISQWADQEGVTLLLDQDRLPTILEHMASNNGFTKASSSNHTSWTRKPKDQ